MATGVLDPSRWPESLRRREAAPVARGPSYPHDANGSDARPVCDVGGANSPEPIGREPQIWTVAAYLGHAGEEIESAKEIAVDALGDEPSMAVLDFEVDVFEVALGRGGEFESGSHSPLRRRSSMRRRTCDIIQAKLEPPRAGFDKSDIIRNSCVSAAEMPIKTSDGGNLEVPR